MKYHKIGPASGNAKHTPVHSPIGIAGELWRDSVINTINAPTKEIKSAISMTTTLVGASETTDRWYGKSQEV